jgi:hypothetical protein
VTKRAKLNDEDAAKSRGSLAAWQPGSTRVKSVLSRSALLSLLTHSQQLPDVVLLAATFVRQPHAH